MPEPKSALLTFAPELAGMIAASPCKIIMTGGSGWIGQAILEMLDGVWAEDLSRHVDVFGLRERNLPLRSGRSVPCYDVSGLKPSDVPNFFIHCAFLTRDKLQDQSVADFVAANQRLSDTVLDFVAASDVRGIFTPSSGAVYKKGTHILDDDLEKNAYGVMKIADEERFTAIARRKNIPLCMPRLFNLAGPFINKHEIYAVASMINAVLRGEAIKIRAAHKVVRSYIHVADLIQLAFAMLLRPRPGDVPVFDTVGEEKLELSELAEFILKTLTSGKGSIERPPVIEGQDDVYVGDGAVWSRTMQAHQLPVTPMSRQIRDTADYLRDFAASLEIANVKA